jgi:hypothetical protein
MTTDSLKTFILKSEDNFRIGVTVIGVWPEIRQQIVAGFLARLETRLKKELKGWQFRQNEHFIKDRSASFDFCKTAWADEYTIGLAADEHGSQMAFGVCLQDEKDWIRKRPFSNELLRAIVNGYPTAKLAKPYWAAKVFMQSPASDWQKPDVLWQMKTDSTFLDDVAGQLLKVAEISEPIIDRLVRKHKK